MKTRTPRRRNRGSGTINSRVCEWVRGCVGRTLFCILAGFLLPALSSPIRAEGDVNSEYQVKLAFLYNFAQFVEWPADTFRDARAPLVICVAGENPFQGEIGLSLRGRTVRGHPIDVRDLHPGEDPHDCQIVFVRAAEMKEGARIFASSKGSGTLTVGEAKGFAERGGVINLTRQQNQLRFEININAAAQTQLKLSSKLLALAKIVGN